MLAMSVKLGLAFRNVNPLLQPLSCFNVGAGLVAVRPTPYKPTFHTPLGWIVKMTNFIYSTFKRYGVSVSILAQV